LLSVQAERIFAMISFFYRIRVGKNDFGNYIFYIVSWAGVCSMLIRYLDYDLTVIGLSNDESHSDFIADALPVIVLNKNIMLLFIP